MAINIKIVRRDDENILANVAPGVFDHPIDRSLSKEFLDDARHHLVIAVENEMVIGFASAIHYVHPDKPPELWINEVGVAPTHQGRGLAKALLDALFEIGREARCVEAWVLTDRHNHAAMRLYSSVGGAESPNDQVMFTFRLRASPKTTNA